MVEAGQGDEGDVVVVEGAGQRRGKNKEERREKNRLLEYGSSATFWSGG